MPTLTTTTTARAALPLALAVAMSCGAPPKHAVEPEAITAPEEAHAGGEGAKPLARASQAPDFALEDSTGRTRTLSEFLASGPVVLVFYHGFWC